MTNNEPDYDNLYFEDKKMHTPQVGDYVMAEYYKAELAKVKKQLAIAIDDLYVIASNANPDFNRMEYAEKSLKVIKELEK